MSDTEGLKIAFVHPDLGIGGAERLVVDAALGLQELGHKVDIYTSHHDPTHCFEETKDGRLTVHNIVPPFPRSINGKFHILLAHLRQLHLTMHLLQPTAPTYDVYFVDQLSTCVPLLRDLGHTRVVFYCHFPDKLLSDGAFVDGKVVQRNRNLLKSIYRYPMDWLEEVTTRQADIILANSKFTSRVFKSYFSSIQSTPRVVYPGINFAAYEQTYDSTDADIRRISSDRPTLISLNRFERKKNAALAVRAFAVLKPRIQHRKGLRDLRLVLAGGYDPRLEDNLMTLVHIIDVIKSLSLSFEITKPASSSITIPPLNTPQSCSPDVLILLNFSTPQRSALLSASSTLALLYTPTNEHFGIGPVEGMYASLPVLACNSGGPTESIIVSPPESRTGWLCPPEADKWAEALTDIVNLSKEERKELGERAKERARSVFGMDAMAWQIESALVEATSMGRVGMSWVWAAVVGLVMMLMALPLVMFSR